MLEEGRGRGTGKGWKRGDGKGKGVALVNANTLIKFNGPAPRHGELVLPLLSFPPRTFTFLRAHTSVDTRCLLLTPAMETRTKELITLSRDVRHMDAVRARTPSTGFHPRARDFHDKFSLLTWKPKNRNV